LDEPEAKAAMIWIVGQYADRIENSDELLDDFAFSFKEEPAEVSVACCHRRLRLGLVQSVEVLAQCADNTFVLVGVPSEDILDDNNGFLNDIADLCLHQVKQRRDALIRDENVSEVLAELKEYASEVDVDFVRKAVRSIGRLAINLASLT
jgi:vesicle coat complex subunit